MTTRATAALLAGFAGPEPPGESTSSHTAAITATSARSAPARASSDRPRVGERLPGGRGARALPAVAGGGEPVGGSCGGGDTRRRLSPGDLPGRRLDLLGNAHTARRGLDGVGLGDGQLRRGWLRR